MRELSATLVQEKEICYHCGDSCAAEIIYTEEKPFCCTGCQAVYELLYANNLCTYYNLEDGAKPGISGPAEDIQISHFAYLDEPATLQQLLTFQSDSLNRVLFQMPGMHCSSCIWLLENLSKLDGGVLESRVNFPRREISISYCPQ